MQRADAYGPVEEEEFLALPESLERLELLDGEVYLAPSPGPIHQGIVGALYRRLADWAEHHVPAFVGLALLDVRLRPGRIVQSDLFVVLRGLSSDTTPLDVIPDLVVEVLSSNRGYDRLAKRLVYAQAGILEYWIVDPANGIVELVHGTDTVRIERLRVRSDIVPGLEVDLKSILA